MSEARLQITLAKERLYTSHLSLVTNPEKLIQTQLFICWLFGELPNRLTSTSSFVFPPECLSRR